MEQALYVALVFLAAGTLFAAGVFVGAGEAMRRRIQRRPKEFDRLQYDSLFWYARLRASGHKLTEHERESLADFMHRASQALRPSRQLEEERERPEANTRGAAL